MLTINLDSVILPAQLLTKTNADSEAMHNALRNEKLK